MSRDAWKRVHPDPCNASVQRRNEAATREALKSLDDDLTNVENQTSSGGDGLLPFVVSEAGLQSDGGILVKVADRTVEPWSFDLDRVAYDPSVATRAEGESGQFEFNAKVGHFGWCRVFPEKGDDAVEIVTLEGQSRFLSGELDETMPHPDGETVSSANATIDLQWGAYPNSYPIDVSVSVEVFDRSEMLAGKPQGTKILAIYDETRDEYVAFGGTGAGDTILPFVVEELGFNGRCKVLLADRSTDPLQFTTVAYANDPFFDVADFPDNPPFVVEHGLFFRNMKPGHFGFCRLAPELEVEGQDTTEVEILTLEGRARFVTGQTIEVGTAAGARVTVEYYFGAYPNGFPVSGEVFLVDRLNMLRNTGPGTEALGIYDEQLDEYVAIARPAVETYEPGAMVQLEICDPETNACAAFVGIAHRFRGVNDENDEHVRCAQPVFVLCENRELSENTDYSSDASPSAPLTIKDSYDNNLEDWCDWGRDTGLTLTCEGNQLPVITIRCPCEACVCPEEGQKLYALYTPLRAGQTNNIVGTAGTEPECAFPVVEMCCVDDWPFDTVDEPYDPPRTGPIWYGEFEVTGWYPTIGFLWDLEVGQEITYDSVEYDEVWVAWVPLYDDPWDGRNFRIYILIEGATVADDRFVEVSYPVYLTGSRNGPARPIWDDRGYVHMVGTRFRYALGAHCNASAQVTINRIAHLRLDILTTTVDSCDSVEVPTLDALIGDQDSMDGFGPDPDCCYTGQWAATDADFGKTVDRPTPVPTIDSSIDANENEIAEAYPYEHHVFGGCLDLIAQRFDALSGSILYDEMSGAIVENGDENTGRVAFTVYWNGTPAKQEC